MKSFKEKAEIPLGSAWLMSSIAEYKGKEELYLRQSPQALERLKEIAMVESAESSNRIEGITVDKDRLRPIVLKKSKPRDRSEEEVVGYRNALDLIHGKHKHLEISPETIKKLHKLCVPDAHDAGKWKMRDNEIIKKHKDGRVEIIFRPVPAKDTPRFIDDTCLLYRQSVANWKYPALYAIACLVLDFLCVHPFRDGNGRVSRLLTLLALYQHGYGVGKYISIEKIIEDSKETYYDALRNSSQDWHRGRHEIEPWLDYFLGSLGAAYRKFEERAGSVKSGRGVKSEIIERKIEAQEGEFTFGEIVRSLPGVGRDMIKLIFKRMAKSKKIRCLGKGQGAKWIKTGR